MVGCHTSIDKLASGCKYGKGDATQVAHHLMVEYRQRLRVMLSSSQGKYDLQKYSIAKNIKYIYYFTYFHPYSTHPFWYAFDPIIKDEVKPCLEELKKSVECLQEMHETLKETVSTYSNPNNLIEKSVETIRCDINFIECDLNCYVVEELLTIKVQLECKKGEFDQKIKCSCEKLSSEISFVKTTLRITTKITYTFKTTIKTMSQIKGDYSHQIQHVIKEISENFEKTVVSTSIETRLQRICDYINKLKDLNTKLPNLSDLTCDKPVSLYDFCEKIKDIEKYINKLECEIEYIRNRKSKLQNIIKKNSQNTSTTQSSGKWEKYLFKERSGHLEKKSMEFDVYYQKEVTKVENLIIVKDTISELLKVVFCDIDKLDEQVKTFKEHLKTVKEQLEVLQTIRGFSEELRGLYFIGQLNKIRGISNNLNCDKDDEKIIKWKKYYHYWYSQYIKLIRDNVQRFLLHSEIENAGQTSATTDTQCSSNPHLVSANAALHCVNTELDKLEKYGNNVVDLIKMARILTDLVPFLEKVGNVLCKLENELQQLGGQDTTSQQLDIINTFRDTVDNAIRTIEGYIDSIKAIGDAGEEITKQYQKYKDKFTAFNKALEGLKTCLDYRIGQFLRCSIGTTICNYNSCPTLITTITNRLRQTPTNCTSLISETLIAV